MKLSWSWDKTLLRQKKPMTTNTLVEVKFFCFRLFAIKTWWLEKDLFSYGKDAQNNLTLVGHYTQMVWAATHKVGCGINECQMKQNGRMVTYFTYICNYCPMWEWSLKVFLTNNYSSGTHFWFTVATFLNVSASHTNLEPHVHPAEAIAELLKGRRLSPEWKTAIKCNGKAIKITSCWRHCKNNTLLVSWSPIIP